MSRPGQTPGDGSQLSTPAIVDAVGVLELAQVPNGRHDMAMVLVVDDHPVNRELVRTVLGYCGHDTLEAGDGVQALALLRRQHPDLVLTDLAMPGMDGYELARAITSDPASQGIPVLFYTANYLPDAAIPITVHGVSRIVPKTGDLAALIEAVEDAVRDAC